MNLKDKATLFDLRQYIIKSDDCYIRLVNVLHHMYNKEEMKMIPLESIKRTDILNTRDGGAKTADKFFEYKNRFFNDENVRLENVYNNKEKVLKEALRDAIDTLYTTLKTKEINYNALYIIKLNRILNNTI